MGPEVLLAALLPLSLFALIFGIVYIRNKENMALIERGINPRITEVRPRHFVNLKWGLLLAGAGAGLLIAYFVDYGNPHWNVSSNGTKYRDDNEAIYFALIAVGGGIGLVCSYLIERKYWESRKGGNDQAS